MPSKKDDLIVDLLQEVREDQKAHSTILIDLKQDVATNTVDLAEHKEGVIQNRARIVKLEEPRIAFKLLKKYLVGASAVAGSVLVILKFLDLL